MARPKKIGLDYFSFDVTFFSDKKIKRLRARFGSVGIEVYIYLLCEIYRNGYYIDYDDDLILDISDEVNISENATKQIMNYLLSRSLFNDKLAKSVKVLTAASVQRRYQEAKKGGKKDIEVEEKLWVLSKEETYDFVKLRPEKGFSEINDSFSEKNADKSQIYGIKKSKEKKSKVYYLSDRSASESESKNEKSAPSFEDVLAFAEKEHLDVNAYKFFEYYHKNNWHTKNGEPISDWKNTLRYWAQQERKGNPVKVKKEIESDMAEAYKSLIYNIDYSGKGGQKDED